MNTLIYNSALSGEVKILPSKSHLHRLLIACALSGKESVINGYTGGEPSPYGLGGGSEAEDMLATISCLNALGAEIKTDDNNKKYYVKPISIKTPIKNAVLNCNESGTTLRFMVPVAAILGCDATFTGSERLMSRPLQGLRDCLAAEKNNPGKYEIDATVSSQYISGLLLALPLKGGEIILQGQPASKDYINITLDVLRDFGINVKEENNRYIVPKKEYIPPANIVADGDWSNAAFWLAAGALSGEVKVTGLNLNSSQGDKKILNVLKDMGAYISIGGDSVTVKKSALRAVNVNARDIPDLVPILSVLCANASGESSIEEIERLRDKESDRIEAVLSTLSNLNGTARYDKKLFITGGKLKGGDVDGCNDHRIVMSATIAGAAAEGSQPVKILGTGAVKKSYPDFFDIFSRLGGKMEMVN